jgi:signal recognition particle subunit SRP54
MLVSVDVYRPAAREQLKVVAKAVGAHLYEGSGVESNTESVVRLAKEARREAIINGCDVLIVDTAGRLHIDEQLMEEMQSLKRLLTPQEVLFVADAMTGQDAVNSAKEFHDKLTLTGVVLTKMDGDARGGAALSIRAVTGQPIKFLGVGEKYDAIEPFHPDRVVGRILGMGDILSLIEQAEEKLDKKKSEEFAKKAFSGDGFSLEDFREQLRQMKKMGSLQSIIGHAAEDRAVCADAPGGNKVDEKQLSRIEAIINSMTPYERDHHEAINGSRRKRIARGSGTSVPEVNNLLRQLYAFTRICSWSILREWNPSSKSLRSRTAARSWACWSRRNSRWERSSVNFGCRSRPCPSTCECCATPVSWSPRWTHSAVSTG